MMIIIKFFIGLIALGVIAGIFWGVGIACYHSNNKWLRDWFTSSPDHGDFLAIGLQLCFVFVIVIALTIAVGHSLTLLFLR